jgi:hypothetical protein
MDLLARAAALAACPLFEDLAPPVVIRLAERAHATALSRGERRTTEDTVWVVASGKLAVRGAPATAGNVLGMIRVVRIATPIVELIAEQDSELVGLAIDDVRDVLEEDPVAVAALANRLAALLLDEAA